MPEFVRRVIVLFDDPLSYPRAGFGRNRGMAAAPSYQKSTQPLGHRLFAQAAR